MKPPKELNLPYPKALKIAEQAMIDTEQAYADFLERIERYKTRLEELRTEKAQLHQVAIDQTAAGQLEDESDSRRHYEKVAFIDHELERYEQALKQIDTGHGKGEVHEQFRVAKQNAKQEWELYWAKVQEAATDHVIGAVGAYLTEAVAAHGLSAWGDTNDWLLDVLSPRIEALVKDRRDVEYAVQTTSPKTPKEIAAEAAAAARLEASEAELKARHERQAAEEAEQHKRRKWQDMTQSMRAAAPWLNPRG